MKNLRNSKADEPSSELSSDDNTSTANLYIRQKKPAFKKPAEQDILNEDFPADEDEDEESEEDPIDAEEVSLVEDPPDNGNDPNYIANNDSNGSISLVRIGNPNPEVSVINPRLPKPVIKYETIQI